MATTTQWIDKDYLFTNYPNFNGNIEPATINALIVNAQDDYIYNALGTNLYNAIQTQIINSGSPQGNYATLVDDYCARALVHWTAFDAMTQLMGRITNKGLTEGSSDYSSPLSLEKIQALRDGIAKKASSATQRISDYLCQNSSLFPELYSNNGVDEKNPSGSDGKPNVSYYNPNRSRSCGKCNGRCECSIRII